MNETLRDQLLAIDALLTAATTRARADGSDEVAAFLETANDQVDAAHATVAAAAASDRMRRTTPVPLLWEIDAAGVTLRTMRHAVEHHDDLADAALAHELTVAIDALMRFRLKAHGAAAAS